MIEKSKAIYRKHPAFFRYAIMAAVIVSIEYATYLLLLNIMSYLLATPTSMLLGIVLNWYFSRVFVFDSRRHATHKEFALVFITSLVGIALQTGTAFVVVSIIGLTPAIAKLLAIAVTFFFNFYVRKKYIF